MSNLTNCFKWMLIGHFIIYVQLTLSFLHIKITIDLYTRHVHDAYNNTHGLVHASIESFVIPWF